MAAIHACLVMRYGDFFLLVSLRVAESLPDLIQLLAVGREIPRNAHASSSVSEYASIVASLDMAG